MRRLILLLSAFATLAAGGTPLAAQAVRDNPRAGLSAGPKAQGGLWKASAGYLQLSPRELRARLQAGNSLAQIATAQGKSVDGLRAALVVAFRAKVERAASAGRIDSARAERLRERAPALVERLVQRTPHVRGTRVYARGGVLRVAGNYLGLTPKELVYELRNGTSLADLAGAHGKSVDGLEAALFAAFKAKVDAAVAAGRLDAARAQRVLRRAPVHIHRLVNRSRG
jgi:lambda repressor-like predicted transcriptional regulator